MNKPAEYDYYADRKNHISTKDWPEECRNYKLYTSRLLNHPEWANLTFEEQNERIQENREAQAAHMRDILSKKTPEEITKINIKKGSYYNDASPERKREIAEQLRQRSLGFWNGMTEDEKDEFSKRRWEMKTDEERKVIVDRFIAGGKRYQKNLTHEEIMEQVERLNTARKIKRENNPEWAAEQDKLLRKHNTEAFYSMTQTQMQQFLHDNQFNHRFEEQFRSSILANNFWYEKEYEVRSGDTAKHWDYAIYNKNNELVMVVDLDGAFYHADDTDYNGKHSNEDIDERRGLFIPEGVSVHIIGENHFIQGFEEMVRKLVLNYDEYIEYLFRTYRSMPFPDQQYSDNELIKSYNQLMRLNARGTYNMSIRNREGDRLIQHFHPSIYRAHRKGSISPYDAWQDDELLRKCIKNRTLYRSSIDRNKILQGFNIAKIAQKVSVFSAGRAKMIIDQHLSGYDTVFDPFSGFSGRMLGTVSLGKRYIGQDISLIHVNESNKMIDFLHRMGIDIDATVEQKDILTSSGEYPCLFTCPPYEDIEQWQDVPVSTRTCDEWIDICLERFDCRRYLFVVDETITYRDFIVDTIQNKSHLGRNCEYIVMIDMGT